MPREQATKRGRGLPADPRRALGYKLYSQATLLLAFVAYLEQAQAVTVTIELAVAWATDPAGADLVWWAKRVSVVRQFAGYLNTIDPECEVPPARLLPYRAGERPRTRTRTARSRR